MHYLDSANKMHQLKLLIITIYNKGQNLSKKLAIIHFSISKIVIL